MTSYQNYLETTLNAVAKRLELEDYSEAEGDPIQKSAIWCEAARHIDGTRGTLGQALLAILWEIYKDGLVEYQLGLGGEEYNPDDFPKWAVESLDSDPFYTSQMSFIVVGIFQDVYFRESNNAVFFDELGQEITVSRLIETEKILTRLQAISPVYPLVDDEEKRTLLNEVLYAKNRDEVRDAADTAKGGRGKITVRYAVEDNGDGTYNVSIDSIDADTLNFLEKKMGKAGEQIFA